MCVLSFSCKKQAIRFGSPGIYDWSYSVYSGKIITSDSVNRTFSIEIKQDYEVYFFEDDKLLFHGYANYLDNSTGLNNGYRDNDPLFKIKDHTFSRYNFTTDSFSISNFPYASFNFNDRPINLIPSSFVSNTFVKR